MNFVEYPLFDSKDLRESRAECLLRVQEQFRDNPQRRRVLDDFFKAICEKRNSPTGSSVHIVFICTHNSRRSQMAQVWAQCIADDLNLDFLICHSAGTEKSIFHTNAIEALVKRGFVFEKESTLSSQGYGVSWKRGGSSMLCFSKTLADASLPKEDFIAVTVCDDADRECPLIPGATHRISLPFVDPKGSDHSANTHQIYSEKSDEIANQIFYVLSHLLAC